MPQRLAPLIVKWTVPLARGRSIRREKEIAMFRSDLHIDSQSAAQLVELSRVVGQVVRIRTSMFSGEPMLLGRVWMRNCLTGLKGLPTHRLSVAQVLRAPHRGDAVFV